jgi:mono/diheme cytochrome c family protein
MSKTLAAACTAWCLLVIALAAQDRTVWDGVYTTEQAGRGQSAYTISCEGCHQADLSGGPAYDADAPALKRENFAVSRKDLGNLYSYVSTDMPKDNPGSLSESTYADILAFLLQQNGMPAGQQELPKDHDALAAIRIVQKP